ncbi:MAG: DNA polymerase III subunit epsilon [Proteobacteria bacterium]|nr:DNA polymerase III subunit epsilon [Pseudomonadota bacterium]MDA1299313.1 DNA polymerase III subunit epsilon [Pseudomonadota bacterium]
MRQVVVDTETTGLEVEAGHRILELGCVEIVGRKLTRRHFHHYIDPQREIDDGALEIHGITRSFLRDKPVFADVWPSFLEFINGAELIIHNAPFDVEFLNYEMAMISPDLGVITDYCNVVDSLELARNKHPGQRNNLDALCKRYNVDNSQRDLHGALLDAEILADVYLLLTGGQVSLGLDEVEPEFSDAAGGRRLRDDRPALAVIRADSDEIRRHEAKLAQLDREAEDGCAWIRLDTG